jgi:hypothetical protein
MSSADSAVPVAADLAERAVKLLDARPALAGPVHAAGQAVDGGEAGEDVECLFADLAFERAQGDVRHARAVPADAAVAAVPFIDALAPLAFPAGAAGVAVGFLLAGGGCAVAELARPALLVVRHARAAPADAALPVAEEDVAGLVDEGDAREGVGVADDARAMVTELTTELEIRIASAVPADAALPAYHALVDRHAIQGFGVAASALGLGAIRAVRQTPATGALPAVAAADGGLGQVVAALRLGVAGLAA